ncbi:unnamed protein product [Paramecium pentaurelia]|uniref:Uncharacterized protein n=1 Tax=Paramecium pentaurelia TaxID=43138 RepID=A0A8S1Y4Q1_9CILI|nr:unnamed protein product [Paramecium pentaurelia]
MGLVKIDSDSDLSGKNSHHQQIVFAIPLIVFLFRYIVMTILYKKGGSTISFQLKISPKRLKQCGLLAILSYSSQLFA